MKITGLTRKGYTAWDAKNTLKGVAIPNYNNPDSNRHITLSTFPLVDIGPL
jgi:hypothetical protein